MNVKLVSWTNRPVEVIAWAFANMHNPIEDNLDDFASTQKRKLGEELWGETKVRLIESLAFNPHSSVLEFVNTVWLIDGCSRAFQQQLTRTRMAAYSIQSLRIVDVGNFADRNSYSVGSSMDDLHIARGMFHGAMHYIQKVYRDLLQHGAKVEDARGILPLNIHSPITMAINLRALQHMIEARLCHLAQGEYRQVAKNMVRCVAQDMDPCLEKLFYKPCDRVKFCPMPVNCGKTEYKSDDRYKDKNIEYWLKG